MGLLREYYQALGVIIMRYEATLTCFKGDNAPLPCPDPALRAVRMALDMQTAVRWRMRGHTIGFGVATGTATVGRVGYEGRIDYTAIGSVVNLASRICSGATDGQVIVDPGTAAAADGAFDLENLGTLPMKGFAQSVQVFAVKRVTAIAADASIEGAATQTVDD